MKGGGRVVTTQNGNTLVKDKDFLYEKRTRGRRYLEYRNYSASPLGNSPLRNIINKKSS
jgi:hypothetical protein